MRKKKFIVNVSRLLAIMMLLSVVAFVPTMVEAKNACVKIPSVKNPSVKNPCVKDTCDLVWNSKTDKSVAEVIANGTSTKCTTAVGPKITSHACSDKYPGIYFIFDAKQKDIGYLKVDAELFRKYASFVITIKEGNKCTNYVIAPVMGQALTTDYCYVFFLPNVASAKKIDAVNLDKTIVTPLSKVPYPEAIVELDDLLAQAEALCAGNVEFPLQISATEDGSDVNQAFPWVYAAELDALEQAMEIARYASVMWASEATDGLADALDLFVGQIKADGSDPYFRFDPGPGRLAIQISAPSNAWATRSPLDNRVPANFAGGSFEVIPYPFADSAGKADVLKLNYAHNGTSTFGGISLQAPLSPAVSVPAGATIEFDVYYPKSAQGKFMRWRIRNVNSDIDSYLRDYPYNDLNPDWVGSYMGDTWLMAHHSLTATIGNSSNFILELHGETSRPAETGTLIVANIKIVAPDPSGIPLPNVVNLESQSVVDPLKSLYNEANDLFMVGAIGTGAVTGTRARHYEIFVDGNNLKAEGTHPRGPNWLKNINGGSLSGATTAPGTAEYSFPTSSYQAIRDSGEPGEYKAHAHVLAWYNQAPAWMRQIVPATLPSGYNDTTDFYGLGNNVTTQVKVDKDMARRVQFNHTMYVMRHFLTTDAKYGSSAARGIIPFNSWDVLNEEIHESRHSELIPVDPNNWRTSLKHTNWLVAMSDDLIGGDLSDHYVYLLFKYAHIAAPNAQMAAAYKANYASLPEYMKLDGHDTDGSIDAYIVDEPPQLTYNDYGIATRSKARTLYNMIRALNTAWLADPLYDGRPLIEIAGIQGHDSIGPDLASNNQYAVALYASLVDQGLLSGISYSEFDLKVPTSTPGGGATAPATLNVKQSDALGYQYALMYKMFTKFAPYIDHIISWGVSGSGWQGSYVLFDSASRANAGYYGAMNPDRYILGHSYLDEFFDGEYEALQDEFEIDLGDLGVYVVAPAEDEEQPGQQPGHCHPGHRYKCFARRTKFTFRYKVCGNKSYGPTKPTCHSPSKTIRFPVLPKGGKLLNVYKFCSVQKPRK